MDTCYAATDLRYSCHPHRLTFDARAPSSDPIHYSQVVCDGSEERITECSKSNITSGCSHLSDAVIACRPGEEDETGGKKGGREGRIERRSGREEDWKDLEMLCYLSVI